MLPPSRYPRQRLIIALTLATGLPAALVQGIMAFVANDSWGSAVIAFGTLMLPPVILAWLLTEPTRNSLGLVLAYASFFTLAGGALFGVLFWYGMAFVAASLGGGPTFMFMELAVLVPYVVLGVAVVRTTKDLYGDVIVKENGVHLLVVILLYVAAVALGSGFHSVVSAEDLDADSATRGALRRAVFRVEACAIGYALAHPDSGYPPSLAAMGPAGQKCLDKRLATGRPKGLLVEYEPAPPNAGRIPSFIVRAQATRKKPASGEFRTAIGDTSGLVGEQMSTDSATRIDMRGEMIDRVAQLRTCALLVRAEHPDRPVASSIKEMAARLGHIGRGDLRGYFCNSGTLKHSARLEERDSLWMWEGYTGSYTAVRDGSGRLSDFEIVARPLAYGESGVRSYFVRSDGPMHVTLADRAATPSDAVVPACEYGERWYDPPRYTGTGVCARMPSVERPAVVLVHDTVARLGQPITVAIRDKSDPTRPADSTYEHHLACGTTPGAWMPPESAPGIFRVGSELVCVVDVGAWGAAAADTLHIVLHTRDRSGAIGKVRSVVRVVRDSTQGALR